MKNIRYIVPLLAMIAIVACQNDDVVTQCNRSGEIVITADIPATRTAYNSENGVTKVLWVEGDAIGIVINENAAYEYVAAESGSYTHFYGKYTTLKAAEGDTIWACYPYMSSRNNPFEMSMPNMGRQQHGKGLAETDLMIAQAVVENGQANLHFKHQFAVLRITVPVSLLYEEEGEFGVTVKSTENLSVYNSYVNIKSGMYEYEGTEKQVSYYLDRGVKDSALVTCDIAILPQSKGTKLTIYRHDNVYGPVEDLCTKVVSQDMQAGHIYTMSISAEEIEEQVKIDRNALIAFYHAMGGDNWVNNTNWCSDKPLNEWFGVVTTEFGTVKELNLDSNNLVGTIPPEIGDLAYLKRLSLCLASISGGLPEEFGKLDRLDAAHFNLSNMAGPLPLCIVDCENLRTIDFVGNKFTGSIPKEYAVLMDRMKDTYISFSNNNLSGVIPEEIIATEYWKYNWTMILSGNQFLPTNSIHVPEVDAMAIDRKQIETNYENNKLTILFHWASHCSTSMELIPVLNKYYEKYKDKGLDIISHTPGWWSESVDAFVEEHGIKFPVIMDVIEEVDHRETGIYDGQPSDYFGSVVGIIVGVDKDKNLQFTNLTHTQEYIEGYIEKSFAEIENTEFYTSVDYSNDGQVVQLQEATEGRGIDIVFMGDGYSDRLHADGTYDEHMRKGMEAFFMEEPYKSHRHLFNIYSVDVVSANDVYEAGSSTALSCCFNEGTEVAGNDGKALQYALKALPVERIEDAVISVVVNTPQSYGTCYMYNPISENDYNNGLSIVYSAVEDAADSYAQLIHHEVGGHGFGKLGDEYFYDYKGHITSSYLDGLTTMAQYGWYRNVSATNDLSTIKWKHFIEDPRYAHENLGAYEGAFTFITGAYRPTNNSIMNQNVGGYNAPSRESIYYRINKLAFGDSWQYDYETFVQYDLAHQTATRGTEVIEKKTFVTAPPVHVNKHWSELLK